MSEHLGGVPDAASETVATMSRRAFLRTASYGLAAGMGGLLIHNELSNAPASKDPSFTTESLEGYEPDARQYSDDAKAALRLLGGETAGVVALKAMGIPTGNAGLGKIKEQARKQPVRTGVSVVAVAPLAEEAVFRLAPSLLADAIQPSGRGSRRWLLGGVSSVLFAKIHNVGMEEPQLPAPQFVTGLFNWWVQRRYGYKHAVATHATINAVAYPIILGAAFLEHEPAKDDM